MSDSIYNLIKENRRLFYTGQIRNKYKSEINTDNQNSELQAVYTISKDQIKKPTLASRSMDILQELFAE